MVEHESGGSNTFDLPEEVFQVLPSDPFEQLDVARKITSIALSTRVASLESESSSLRARLAEKDDLLSHLQSQLDSLDASLSDTSAKLAQAELDKEKLLEENAVLSNTVRKLQRDVSKLEVFRKTLMQSLQEDNEETSAGHHHVIAKPTPSEDDAVLRPPSRTSSMRSQNFEMGNFFAEDRDPDSSRPGLLSGMLLASQTTTPRLTPPGSPPLSASGSPTRTSRRHSMSFSTFDRSSLFSSLPPNQHSSMSSSDSGSIPGKARVDGKEFFRQVRSRLSYEQFGAFLASVKELNSHKLTKEEALKKADEIFGPDNRDLYGIFEGLITRSVAH